MKNVSKRSISSRSSGRVIRARGLRIKILLKIQLALVEIGRTVRKWSGLARKAAKASSVVRA
jgi:hypothetical protein